MAAQKVLRVGVIQGGKIVEERIFPARASVTIGSSQKASIVVPASDLPAAYQLLSFQGSGYVLHFEESMEGRIQSPQGASELGAIIAQGGAKQSGKSYALSLREDHRGKVMLGEVTVLFQFVAPPPEAPKLVLPREAKGNHFKSMDRLFVSLLTVSLLTHGSCYGVLANTEVKKEVTLEEIPDRYAKLLIPEKQPERPKPVEEKPAATTEAAPAKQEEAKAEPDAGKKQGSPAEDAQKKAAHAAAVAKAVQSKGILKVLGSLGPGGGGGAVADVFGSGGGIGDVATALSGAGGVAVATDPGAGGGRKGGGQGGAASIGDLATSGGGNVGLGTKSEVRVSGSVATEAAEIDSSEIDQGKLNGFVRARMGLVKACYENALKRNPNLKGKLTIRFTILETGGLADIVTALNTIGSSDVASCIIGTMRTWRTQFRPSGPVTVEYPFVFSPVN
ncbi:MAG: AgmX/PglI C-terminal domain-containing protein [Anaeromyxobacteraceae bacterium]